MAIPVYLWLYDEEGKLKKALSMSLNAKEALR